MLELSELRDEFVGKRVLVSGKRLLACPNCGSHLQCYRVCAYHYHDEKQRLHCPALEMECPSCWYSSVFPVYPHLAGKLQALNPVQ